MTTQRQIQLCLLSICAKVSNQMMFLLFTRNKTGVTSGVYRWCNVSVIASNAVDWESAHNQDNVS